MVTIGILSICLSCSLCLYLVLALIRQLNKLWWTPIRIQHQMHSQGINGPPYKFFYGSNKDISNMKKEAMVKPMDLSHDILYKAQPHIHAWIKKYGKNFLLWNGSQPELIVTEPELIKEILNNRDNTYVKEKPGGYIDKLLGDGLVFSTGEKWTKMRKLANNAFHAESLKNLIPAMITSAEVMLERWKIYEGKEMEVFEEFTLLTSEVISRTAFGSSYLEGRNIFEMLTKLTMITARNTYELSIPVISKFYKTKDDIEADELEKGIYNRVLEIIKNTEFGSSTGGHFLELLLTAHHDANVSQRISIKDLVDECKTFYFAGQETTNNLLTWSVFLLSLHTDWQEKARQEVLSLFGHQNPTPDGIAKLNTMSMIINEALRLYPPAISILRKVERKATLGKLTLPANLNVNVSNFAVHHDPDIWGEDVNLFKPERFSEGVAKATNNNVAAFIPFGMGPRICVGSNFTPTEAKVVLSMILQRYAFTLSPTYVHLPFQLFTLRPLNGVQVILHSL
ncbi:hypothetical protein ACJW31_03G196000 [Castanea mollissima]